MDLIDRNALLKELKNWSCLTSRQELFKSWEMFRLFLPQKPIRRLTMKPYNNPAWEPMFHTISPILSKAYFATDIGPLRRVIATLIFKKLSIREWMGKG